MSTIMAQGILVLATGVFAFFTVLNIKKIYKQVKAIRDNNKLIDEKKKTVQDMKDRGDHHEWINLPLPTGETHVCRKTGYCPSLDGFVPLEAIEKWEENQKEEQRYKEYRDSEIENLAMDQGITIDEMEDLAEAIFSMKKRYYVKKMEESLKEMGVETGMKIKLVSSPEDLKEVLDELKDKKIQ